MTYPSAQSLAIARSQAENLLTDTATHYVKTDTTSSSGARTAGFVQQGATIPCLVYMLTSGAIPSEVGTVAGTTADVATHNIRVPHDTSISAGDRLVVDGAEFSVVSVLDSDTTRFLLSVAAIRVRDGKLDR